MEHKDLVEVAYKWILKRGRCGVAFKELKSVNAEIPDAIGFNSWSSVVVECKVSRGDFLQDKHKEHRKKGMGSHRFYCCPKGLIKKEELPEGWGLIYVDDKMKATCVVNPYNEKFGNIWTNPLERDIEAEQRLMYTALRRLFIKGHVKHIYDKDYNRSATADDLIILNSEPNAA